MIAEKRKLFFSFQVIQTATGDARQHHGRQPCIPVRLRQWAWGPPTGSCGLHAGPRFASPQASPTGLRGSPPTCLAAAPPCSLGCPHSWCRDLQGIRGVSLGLGFLHKRGTFITVSTVECNSWSLNSGVCEQKSLNSGMCE